MNLMKIAYRNVSRQKRRSNLLGIAIAFGVMIIILVNSLTSGLISNTEDNFTSALGGHIYITGEVQLDSGRVVSRIEDPQVLEEVIPQFSEYIEAYEIRSTINGSFVFRSKTERGVLYGVDWQHEKDLADTLKVVEGDISDVADPEGDRRALALPQAVAEELGVVLGEEILLSFNTVTGQANVGEFIIKAITVDASGLGFTAAYADIDYVNELLGLDSGEYQTFNLVLKDVTAINAVTSQLKSAIEEAGAPLKPESEEEEGMVGVNMGSMFGAGVDEEPWDGTRFNIGNLNDYMDMVTQIVAILNGIALGMFLMMLMITMVGLVNTFRMIMIERTKEIGTMRSVGMLRKHVSRLFLFEGLILALRGTVFGIAAAGVVGIILRMIPFSSPNFALLLDNGRISVPIVPSNILLVLVIIIAITMIAVWSPARKAASLQPADALRS
ncbi:MAG: FtsX-like permease family protein [Spirochaetales bacterium]|nr:FtsX-like permease family protein [Spirochaetales bacterium]